MWNMTTDTRHYGKQAVLFLLTVLVRGGTEEHRVTEKRR